MMMMTLALRALALFSLYMRSNSICISSSAAAFSLFGDFFFAMEAAGAGE
jgi:hypothetical protein